MCFGRDVDVRFGDIGRSERLLRRLLALSRARSRWREYRLRRAADDNRAKSKHGTGGDSRLRRHPGISHFLFPAEAAHGALVLQRQVGGQLYAAIGERIVIPQ
jgi:hypothetical protein